MGDERTNVRREFVARKASKNCEDAIVSAAFNYWVQAWDHKDVILSFEEMYKFEERGLSPEDVAWIEREANLREAKSNPDLGEATLVPAKKD